MITVGVGFLSKYFSTSTRAQSPFSHSPPEASDKVPNPQYIESVVEMTSSIVTVTPLPQTNKAGQMSLVRT